MGDEGRGEKVGRSGGWREEGGGAQRGCDTLATTWASVHVTGKHCCAYCPLRPLWRAGRGWGWGDERRGRGWVAGGGGGGGGVPAIMWASRVFFSV